MEYTSDFRIDYLKFSARIFADFELKTPPFERSEISPLRFYKTVKRYENGLVEHIGNPATDKSLFILDGETCQHFNVDADFLKRVIGEWKGTISRLDIAMTTTQEIIPLVLADKKKVESRMFSHDKMKIYADGDMNAETIYFGDLRTRGRKGIVRVYDKARHLGIEGPLQRIEIEFGRKHAHLAAQRIASGASLPAVFNSKFRINADWYEKMFGTAVAARRFSIPYPYRMSEIERKMEWIERQVVPTLKLLKKFDEKKGTANIKRILKLAGISEEST